MKVKIKQKYISIILIIVGEVLMWCNVHNTWNNNLRFILWSIGMLIALVGILLLFGNKR